MPPGAYAIRVLDPTSALGLGRSSSQVRSPGGIRTHTPVRAAVFETAASAAFATRLCGRLGRPVPQVTKQVLEGGFRESLLPNSLCDPNGIRTRSFQLDKLALWPVELEGQADRDVGTGCDACAWAYSVVATVRALSAGFEPELPRRATGCSFL